MGWDEPGGQSAADVALQHEITKMVLWAENSSPRSRQMRIGPSELGDACDRRVAYKIAGTPAVNVYRDPWPAIVGTAIHGWLQKAVDAYQEAHGDAGWLTELGVCPDPLVEGHSDVYNRNTQSVVDWKTAGVDAMRKYRKAVPPGYITQVHLYGLGNVRAGRPVKDVVLVFLPRSGWLGDMFIHRETYNEQIALDALARGYRIGNDLLDLEIDRNPHRFQNVPATPGDSCVWCPLFNKDLDTDVAASDKGCPGR